MAFDTDYEDDILSHCLRDKEFLNKAARICKSHVFSTKERSWIFELAQKNWLSHRECPTVRLVLERAELDFPDKTKRKPVLALAKSVLTRRPASPKTALESLSVFVAQIQLQIAMEKGVKELEKGNVDGAKQALKSGAAAATQERNYTHVRWIEEFAKRQKARKREREHPEEFPTIPTGLKGLDKILSGGARAPEIGLIMGTTGRGKSILLNGFCYNSVKHDEPTLYCALEMPAKQVAARTDSLWTSLRYDQFKRYDFKPTELSFIRRRYEKAVRRFRNKFHIISLPVRTADINVIRSALEDLKDEFGFQPTMIAMDSGDHLITTDRSLDNFRLQQSGVYWDQKAAAEELGVVWWSTVHAGREWAAKIATAEATSESYDKARIADLVLSINDPNANQQRRKVTAIDDDDDEDEEAEVTTMGPNKNGMKRMELFVAKNRDGVSQARIDLNCDFSRMVIKEAHSKEDQDDEAELKKEAAARGAA
jgi:replicative DNA helicase